ncbi:hypothetical protein QC762_0061720 [Podospora pseudocomata]|uniref:Secreted protein n=1 Tax=Podospora pseudocomata TaxID=2093779 RepID=A0ABR0GEB6_9PEZI|nr:hypothetical protein QC762_0061720 [Podospora pseudocomata]
MFLAVATRVLTLQAACRGTKPHYSPKVQGPQHWRITINWIWDLKVKQRSLAKRPILFKTQSYHCITASRHHGITASQHYDIN